MSDYRGYVSLNIYDNIHSVPVNTTRPELGKVAMVSNHA